MVLLSALLIVISPVIRYIFPTGYMNILRLSSNDLHMKNANTQNDSQAMVIDPAKLSK